MMLMQEVWVTAVVAKADVTGCNVVLLFVCFHHVQNRPASMSAQPPTPPLFSSSSPPNSREPFDKDKLE